MSRQKLMYMRDTNNHDYLVEDPYKANNKLASGFYKILVDQKVQYSLGKPVSIKSADGTANMLEYLGKVSFPKELKRVGKSASKKSIGWAQVYIDALNQFQLMHIPAEQAIPVYREEDADELEYFIRYYPVKMLNDKNEFVQVVKVEVWDELTVTLYRQDPESKEYKLLKEKGLQNPRPHMVQKLSYGGTIAAAQSLSWGKVPFIPFYNNDERLYDLQQVKRYIDVYDIVESDFANNLEDIQDIYWVLKGYNGENIDTFLAEVRRYKTLKVSEEGDAHAESVEIPSTARDTMLNRLNDDIFKFGRGVDTSKTGDGNITNIVIKARFAGLDLKASEFESEARAFIDNVMWYLNRFFEINGQERIDDYDVTFNRSLIINETELLTVNASQQGVVSEDTRLANHPWVDDVEEEKAKMEAEKQPVMLTDDPGSMDDGTGDDDGNNGGKEDGKEGQGTGQPDK